MDCGGDRIQFLFVRVLGASWLSDIDIKWNNCSRTPISYKRTFSVSIFEVSLLLFFLFSVFSVCVLVFRCTQVQMEVRVRSLDHVSLGVSLAHVAFPTDPSYWPALLLRSIFLFVS